MSDPWNFQIPNGWSLVESWGWGYALRKGGLRVLIDCSEKADGRFWIHVSYSRKDWVPSHADTCEVKNSFLGNRYAYAVFPASEKYVNIHPNCLHLWALADGSPVLPEFSEELEGIGRSI